MSGAVVAAKLTGRLGDSNAITTLDNPTSSHFITFSCYRRQPLLITPENKGPFVAALERVRLNYRLYVYGYVVMPEHVHMLVSEPEREALAVALKSLKQGVARRLVEEAEHFWQKRYYDPQSSAVL